MNLADGLKQLSRICAKYHEKCDNCPLNNKDFCSLEPADRDAIINERAAAIIEKWAEENVELVYPTWEEWLSDKYNLAYNDDFRLAMSREHIPADDAEKLKIEPKEGT